jgi:hypothetical protein
MILLLAGLSGEAAGTPFQRNLFFGLWGDQEVVRLQDFLRSQGFFALPKSSGNFYTLTYEAVRKFQSAYKISPTGYFGPKTRARANAILGATQGLPDGGIPPSSVSATSSYYGKIVISGVRGTPTEPESEYVILVNYSEKEAIDVTGWSIETSRGFTIKIPRVENFPDPVTPVLDNLILPPQGRVTITMGRQPRQINFQENLCTGYFSETSEFNPSLTELCPRPEGQELFNLSDKCIRAVDRVASCRMPSTSLFFGLDDQCVRYLTDHFSYVGCVRDFRNRPNFFLKKWLVWMQRREEFFRNTHEKIILKDTRGKMVDQQEY